MAIDGKGRIVFHAGSRSTWIYDLKLDNGDIKIWSKQDVENGIAFGLQKKPFCVDIDFIEQNFVSVLTKKEAKWLHKTQVTNIDKEEKPTLLFKLPKVVQAPECSIEFLFALEQQAINVVNKQTGNEYLLVKQRAHCENDCLEDLFLTYERCADSK